jgi:hypothetical protein
MLKRGGSLAREHGVQCSAIFVAGDGTKSLKVWPNWLFLRSPCLIASLKELIDLIANTPKLLIIL